jgi:hypothetical protein
MATLKKLLPYQGAFLQAPLVYPDIRYIMLVTGYGAGKTSSLVDSLMFDIQRLQGKRDREGRSPLLMLCGVTLTFMKRTCVHDLLQALQNTNTQFKYHKDINQIEIGDVTVVLQALEDPSQIYGINSYAQYVDELDELPTEVAMEAVRSLNERLRQQLVGERPPYAKWTTTSQGKKGLYQTVLQFKQGGIPYMIIRGRTKDNIYLPKSYVQAMYAMYNDKERECFLEGQFVAVDSNMVFPDYDPVKNDLGVDLFDSLDEHDTVYLGQDFNSFGCACSAWVLKRGCLVCIKDYDFPDIRRAPEVFRYDFPTQKLVWIPDMTYKEHFGEFKKELRANRINIAYRACNPNVNDRNFAINKCLYTGRMFICPIATRVKKTLTLWQIDPKRGTPMKGGVGAVDHIGDTMGYVAHYLLTWKKELKDMYDLTLKRKYQFKDDASTRNGEEVLTAEEAVAKIQNGINRRAVSETISA